MVLPLVTFDSLHDLLRSLYEDMLPLCGPMTTVASAIACFGGMLYISYRVWQALARAEPIDVFPLLRPFALCLCIVLFKPLVLDTIDGVLHPVVMGTRQLLSGQTFDMQEYQRTKDALEKETLERQVNQFYEVDEDMDKQISDLGLSPGELYTMQNMYNGVYGFNFGLKSIIVEAFRWLLETIFKAASLVIDTIRTFYMIVLAILGPLAFGISVFDGFQATLTQWFTKFISVYLWLPVSDLFGAVLARLQVLSLQADIELMKTDPFYLFDANNMVGLVLLVIGICGYFTVPSVASWIVQASGFGSYNRIVTRTGAAGWSYITGMAGAATARAWNGTKSIFQHKHDPEADARERQVRSQVERQSQPQSNVRSVQSASEHPDQEL